MLTKTHLRNRKLTGQCSVEKKHQKTFRIVNYVNVESRSKITNDIKTAEQRTIIIAIR